MAILVLLLSSNAPARQQKAPFVAVFDIEVQGVELTQEERESLSDYLATRLAETGAFQVIPRQEIRRRLLQKKKDSYKECVDRSCQIALGKEVAAEKSLSTRLSRMGSKCTLSITLYDLKKAATETAATERGRCDMDGIMSLLGRAVGRLAGAGGQLGGKVTVSEFDLGSSADTGRDIENPVVDETGFLFVDSKPRGAAVIINGQEKGTTPFQDELMAGRYVILCAKGALYLPARKEVELTTRGLRMSMELKPNFGVLEVTSDPPGAGMERRDERHERPGSQDEKAKKEAFLRLLSELDEVQRARYDRLLQWRRETSRKDGVPPYVLFTNSPRFSSRERRRGRWRA